MIKEFLQKHLKAIVCVAISFVLTIGGIYLEFEKNKNGNRLGLISKVLNINKKEKDKKENTTIVKTQEQKDKTNTTILLENLVEKTNSKTDITNEKLEEIIKSELITVVKSVTADSIKTEEIKTIENVSKKIAKTIKKEKEEETIKEALQPAIISSIYAEEDDKN